MSLSILVRFLYLVLFIVFVDGQCLDDQQKLLLELRSEFKFNSSISQGLEHWNGTGDCCEWKRVKCDDSGHVISLLLNSEGISGRIGESSALFRLTYLSRLDLSSNDFTTTEIPNQFHRLPNLVYLDLSESGFKGPIPSTLANLTQLVELYLPSNFLTGSIPSFHNCKNLESIKLSDNNLMGSLSHLHFQGLTNLTSINYLYLSNNQFSGQIEEISIIEFPLLRPDANANENESDYYFANFLFLANNRLTGVIPTSICSIPVLMVLDLSFNNLNGSIPPCLLQESYYLQVLNIRGNNINGVIPDTFNWECGLKTFDVSDNNLGGKIPKSLANCVELAVMNVGNNNFDDSFPCMALPESLKVLVLRSNRFHGELRCGKSWPELQILDISSNHFSGTLDSLNFSSWRGMMLQSQAHLRRSASDILSANDLYRDEVTLTLKNVEVKLVKIWPDFTCIDLSSNHFEKEIPDAIGSLTSLYLLNLSHNSLTHAIPISLGALTELESLDLSSNKLTGRIPDELTKLDFLSFLNLSYNHLTGPIPTGRQFQTFSEDSFEGNAGLSGFPLNGSVNNRRPPGPSPSEDSEPKEEEIEWEYVFAASGYVVGIGCVAWTLLCCRSLRERYFEKIEEVADKIFFERGRRKRRHERRVRRRREEKNAVRRRHHQ
ncbi:hypothetical protein SASPL_139113 [Salvia splendens]|uniref:Leucine-rich repeat-containing N-terminal plant-type domain-containing protein n=1 Tax=Salvia splendens TaxID=180675 RepID=A0A8X8ZEI4_SALSN|nr:receptor like protein 22-like [Salvia splendens]KAG6402237.1 hypothetical protein SASPL_139113 [Salvia splendens]